MISIKKAVKKAVKKAWKPTVKAKKAVKKAPKKSNIGKSGRIRKLRGMDRYVLEGKHLHVEHPSFGWLAAYAKRTAIKFTASAKDMAAYKAKKRK